MPRIFSLYYNLAFLNFWIFEKFLLDFTFYIFCIFELFNFSILIPFSGKSDICPAVLSATHVVRTNCFGFLQKDILLQCRNVYI